MPRAADRPTHMPLRRLAWCAIVANWPFVSSRVKILVLTVADSGRETRARLLRNMQHVDATHARHRAMLHWAICAYDDRLHEWADFQFKGMSSVRHVRLIALTNASDALKDRIHATKHSRCCWRKARGALHRALLRTTWADTGRDAYDAVWMLDADLRMEALDLPRFLHRWMCSFEGGAPLVAQPLNGVGGHSGEELPACPEWEEGARARSAASASPRTRGLEEPLPDPDFLRLL